MLETLDVTLDNVRAEVEGIVGRGEAASTGQIAFTHGGKRTLELALREAIALGHNYIGTEHILLGLVRENEGVAARILHDFGADAEKIRNEVVRTMSGPGQLAHVEPEPADVELTSPPLAPEVLAELERLAAAKGAAIDRQSFDEAASLRDAEHRLRVVAAELVRSWRRHIDTSP